MPGRAHKFCLCGRGESEGNIPKVQTFKQRIKNEKMKGSRAF